jgi:hypothetical protein
LIGAFQSANLVERELGSRFGILRGSAQLRAIHVDGVHHSLPFRLFGGLHVRSFVRSVYCTRRLQADAELFPGIHLCPLVWALPMPRALTIRRGYDKKRGRCALAERPSFFPTYAATQDSPNRSRADFSRLASVSAFTQLQSVSDWVEDLFDHASDVFGGEWVSEVHDEMVDTQTLQSEKIGAHSIRFLIGGR